MRLWQLHIGKEMKGKTFCPYSSTTWSLEWALQDDLPPCPVSYLKTYEGVDFLTVTDGGVSRAYFHPGDQ